MSCEWMLWVCLQWVGWRAAWKGEQRWWWSRWLVQTGSLVEGECPILGHLLPVEVCGGQMVMLSFYLFILFGFRFCSKGVEGEEIYHS